MTAPPLAPAAPAADRDHLGHLLRAEWIKLRTVRGWTIGIVIAALLTILLGLWTGAASQEGCPGGPCRYVIPTGPGGEAVTDTYYFVHRPLTTRGSITVRVTSLTSVMETDLTPLGPAQTPPAVVPWSKAGLIISAGARQGSVRSGHGHP